MNLKYKIFFKKFQVQKLKDFNLSIMILKGEILAFFYFDWNLTFLKKKKSELLLLINQIFSTVNQLSVNVVCELLVLNTVQFNLSGSMAQNLSVAMLAFCMKIVQLFS